MTVPATLTPATLPGRLNQAPAQDSFDRPDSSSLGAAETGQSWTVTLEAGTEVSEISGGQYRQVANGGAAPRSVTTTLEENYDNARWSAWARSVTLVGGLMRAALEFRKVDANNKYVWQYDGAPGQRIRLYKQVAGAWTLLGEEASVPIPTALERVHVETVGPVIRAYRANVLRLTITDTAHARGKLALTTWEPPTDNRWDDVLVEPL